MLGRSERDCNIKDILMLGGALQLGIVELSGLPDIDPVVLEVQYTPVYRSDSIPYTECTRFASLLMRFFMKILFACIDIGGRSVGDRECSIAWGAPVLPFYVEGEAQDAPTTLVGDPLSICVLASTIWVAIAIDTIFV